MSLSCSFLALASSANDLVDSCALAPILPKRTVKDLPDSSIDQNLLDDPSLYSNVRISPPRCFPPSVSGRRTASYRRRAARTRKGAKKSRAGLVGAGQGGGGGGNLLRPPQ